MMTHTRRQCWTAAQKKRERERERERERHTHTHRDTHTHTKTHTHTYIYRFVNLSNYIYICTPMRYVLDFHHAFSPTCCHSCCHHTCHQATLSAAGSPPPASCPLASPRSSSERPSVAEHGLTPRFSPRGELGYRGSRWLGPHLGVDGLLVTREGETCITLYHYTIDIYIYIYLFI